MKKVMGISKWVVMLVAVAGMSSCKSTTDNNDTSARRGSEGGYETNRTGSGTATDRGTGNETPSGTYGTDRSGSGTGTTTSPGSGGMGSGSGTSGSGTSGSGTSGSGGR